MGSLRTFLLLVIVAVSALLTSPSVTAGPNSLEWTTFVDLADGSGYVITSSAYVVSTAAGGACYSYSDIHWASNKIPVGYSISTGRGAPSGASGAIEAGFQVWSNAGTSFSFRGGGGNSVSWGNIDGPGETLAVATVWYDARTEEIARATIRFDTSEKWATDGRTRDAFDVQNIAAHEAGHWLMLNDVSCSEETMYRYAAPGETKKRTLGSGDIAGIEFIYSGQKQTGYTITVNVIDSSTGKPVVGAYLYLDGIQKGKTDRLGKLVITGATRGSHMIRVTKTGYQGATQRVSVQSDMSVMIALQR